MSTDRMKIYELVGTIKLPPILEPEDVSTLIADLTHLYALMANYRYMRDTKVVRRMMLEIAQLAMYGMQKFGVAWRDARDKGVAYPEGESFTAPQGSSRRGRDDWARTILSVDCERDYQDKLGPDRCAGRGAGNTIDKNPLSMGASSCLLRHYLWDAVRSWTMIAGSEAVLHCVRKIAAIAIRDLETNGLPEPISGDESCNEDKRINEKEAS